ncbi:DUF1671-domain-containing protein [Stereum hirsutum FP-91666 SS1]|uniref:DUF1671-domain-containing protein n=1 Tax=Stereum hirsutum (strain FP-91666) TaxID=721885 RepID=UPI000440A9D7|nr:DUF1671-domain-containing protein [Stereum hirsutum FP-91666 SS1]EIM90228.1 DUF1671-domain-containing protein [Stereum hirsutum FP-91666 SS1]
MLCQFCSADLDALSPDDRQTHYNRHLDEPSSSTILRASTASTSTQAGAKRKWYSPMKHDDFFWYPAQKDAPPSNFTPGLISLVKKALMSSHEKGYTQRAVLCYDRTVHIYHELWDSGWGCGYRNFLMACTALMDQPIQPEYARLLNEPLPPSVHNLQQMIEDAWKHGFDKEGAAQLNHKLIGTKKWIGTAELYVALAHRGIPSQLVDFNLKGDAGPLINWVKEYFSPTQRHRAVTVHDALHQAEAVTVTDLMPLLLQHQGHSRTIVGYEITKTGTTNLLLFDPAKHADRDLRDAALHKFYTQTPQNANHSAQDSYTHGRRGHGHRARLMDHLKKPFQHSSSSGHSLATSPPGSGGSPVKRLRAGQAPDDDVIVIEDEIEDEIEVVEDSGAPQDRGRQAFHGKGRILGGKEAKVDDGKVLKFVRVNAKSLVKAEKYQILWFPMDEPLNDYAKGKRHLVTSRKIS